MLYGEKWQHPLYINIYVRIIFHWAKLFTCSENEIAFVLYKHLSMYHDSGYMSISLILCIKETVDMCGFSNIWSEQNIANVK